MKYHHNTNSRFRSLARAICKKLCCFYHNGIPAEPQQVNVRRTYEFGIFDSSRKIVSFEPVPVKSPDGQKGKLVAHYGVAPEDLPYLALFS
jgi:hypothetical protein